MGFIDVVLGLCIFALLLLGVGSLFMVPLFIYSVAMHNPSSPKDSRGDRSDDIKLFLGLSLICVGLPVLVIWMASW
ncbi:hypothetical protein KA078_02095 [Candidatus Woesebacteria bacterium]|nr:hypothetical protein [Candidatus Woesebacteria bacterium]